MRIQKIELNGFKSFADRTRLELHPGITCVVGPNGCGKSNVVDAFRWALGEQSAKNLRGSKMEEVIFNGTDQRKPKGMTQVDIVLGGLARETPEGMPTDTVTVSRRLFRSGESEYLINRNSCRLRDIRDIFLDTGLELKTYSILEQGRVGEIINAKASERRFLIEEVAGVVKYKVRKQEALSKLESSRNNLQRVNDITGEVKRQLNALDRQAKKAERYKRMLEEARDLDIALSGRTFHRLSEELAELARKIAELKEREAERLTGLQALEARIEQDRLALLDREREVEAVQNDLYSREKANTELQGRIDLVKQERDNLSQRVSDHQRREEDLRNREADLREQAADVGREAQAMEVTLGDAESRFEDLSRRVREAESAVNEAEENLEQARRELLSVSDAKATLQNRIAVLERDRENLNARLSRIGEEHTGVVSERAEAESRLQEAEKELVSSRSLLDGRKKEREELLERIRGTREELRSAEETSRRAREEVVAHESRLTSLEEIEKEFVGFGEGTRYIAEEGAERHEIQTLGLLADRIRVPAEYETALEAALGERLRTLIVADGNGIRRILTVLGGEERGSGAFVALDHTARGHTWAAPQPGGVSGVRGWAKDLVESEDTLRDLVGGLLKGVLVVETAEHALALWDRDDFENVTLVTLRGETFSPGGVVLAGGGKGLLGKKREIRDLRNAVEKAKARAEEEARALETLRERLAVLERQLEESSQVLRDGERTVVSAERKYEAHKDDVARADKRLAYLDGERRQMEAEIEAIRREIEEKAHSFREAGERLAEREEGIARASEALNDERERLETLRSEGTEARVELNRLRNVAEGLERERTRLELALNDAAKRREVLAAEREGMERRILEADQLRAKTEKERDHGIALAHELQEKRNMSRVRYNEEFEALNEKEAQAKQQRPMLEETRAALKTAEVRSAEVAITLEGLVAKILDEYDVKLAELPPAEIEEGAEQRLRDLRQKMAAMGPVSLGALEEYQELEERHRFLDQQQRDLVESIESIEAAIGKINRTTKKRLTEAYTLLREKFHEVFRTLFGGGRADLILVGEDILEAGLDIQVQPPGKRLQNITLLSGGEKALTALALLFSGFLIKPSPLCILDEVDAPLDESNTDRFAILLKEIAKDVQFVVITHNRRTMEAADILYGATMEEPGVTKIVSMKMAEYAAV